VSAAQDRASAIRNGDRRALARAITLVESTRPDHRDQALALLEAVMPDTGKAIRLGISGAPGVGKSTFIETLGTQLIATGHEIAVLAVDPTSARAGGSILGDKTRMETLGRSANAFIRPSPSGGGLGGVARRSREALLLCEAAGFDVVIVETVGVGQAEIAVRDMVDMFLLLLAPAAGDDLQGIKRGIVEIADLLVVNKADGELADVAMRTRADYQNALDLLRSTSPNWRVPVLAASALEGNGIAEVWQAMQDHRTAVEADGVLAKLRSQQALAWMWSEVTETLAARLRESPAVAARLPEVERAVSEGRESPTTAAAELLAAFLAES
jgi:LAO/AO transport system kinase